MEMKMRQGIIAMVVVAFLLAPAMVSDAEAA